MPKSTLSLYLHIIAIAVIVFALGQFFTTSRGATKVAALKDAAQKESVYTRVMRTKTIRCGYHAWPPTMIKDPNTGQLSGIYYDYMMELGKRLSMDIEWSEEIGLGEFVSALETRRIDAMCHAIWPNSQRAKVMDFVQPIFYDVLFAFTREGSTRFDNNMEAANDPSVKIGVIDGASSSTIARVDFPNAQAVALPEMSTGADLFLQLSSGKVDLIINDLATAKKYMAFNPGHIHQVPTAVPIRVFAGGLAIAKEQDAFRSMLNLATAEMISSGVAEKIIAKYEEYPGSLYRPTKPYQPAP
jgi:ABC-type amino acid transport substrate-binding protein